MLTDQKERGSARGDERRCYPRFALDASVMLVSRSGWAIARTVNLSRGGIAVVSSNLCVIAGLKVSHLYFELPKLAGVDTDAHLVRATNSECVFVFDRCSHDVELALRVWLHACILRAARAARADWSETARRRSLRRHA